MTETGNPPAKVVPLRPPRECPICARRTSRETYPFCSRRCADVDLNRWLSGRYAIPGESLDAGHDGEED